MKRIALILLLLAGPVLAQDYPEYWKLPFFYQGSYGGVTFPQGQFYMNKDSLDATNSRINIDSVFASIIHANYYYLGDSLTLYKTAGEKRVGVLDSLYAAIATIQTLPSTNDYILFSNHGSSYPLITISDSSAGTTRATGTIGYSRAAGNRFLINGAVDVDNSIRSYYPGSVTTYKGAFISLNGQTDNPYIQVSDTVSGYARQTKKISLINTLGMGVWNIEGSVLLPDAGQWMKADTVKANKQLFVYGSDTTTLRHSGDTLHVETSASCVKFNKKTVVDTSKAKAIVMDSTSTLVATSRAGLIEYNGKGFYGTPSNSTRMRFTQICQGKTSADSLMDTDTTSTICSLYVKGGSLTAGDVIRAKMLGRMSTANASQYLTVTFFMGADSIIAVATPAKLVTNTPFEIEFIITVYTLGTTGSLVAYASANIDNVGLSAASNGPNTINTTTANTFKARAKFSSANPSNKLVVNQAFSVF